MSDDIGDKLTEQLRRFAYWHFFSDAGSPVREEVMDSIREGIRSAIDPIADDLKEQVASLKSDVNGLEEKFSKLKVDLPAKRPVLPPTQQGDALGRIEDQLKALVQKLDVEEGLNGKWRGKVGRGSQTNAAHDEAYDQMAPVGKASSFASRRFNAVFDWRLLVTLGIVIAALFFIFGVWTPLRISDQQIPSDTQLVKTADYRKLQHDSQELAAVRIKLKDRHEVAEGQMSRSAQAGEMERGWNAVLTQKFLFSFDDGEVNWQSASGFVCPGRPTCNLADVKGGTHFWAAVQYAMETVAQEAGCNKKAADLQRPDNGIGDKTRQRFTGVLDCVRRPAVHDSYFCKGPSGSNACDVPPTLQDLDAISGHSTKARELQEKVLDWALELLAQGRQ